MSNILKHHMKKYFKEHNLQVFFVYAILLASVVIISNAVLNIFRNFSYTPEQLSYNIQNEKIGYADSGPQGIFSYGPYVNLRKGNYKITIYYETDTDTTFDVCYSSKNGEILKIENGVLASDKNSEAIIICNERTISNSTFEVRTYYQGFGRLQVNEISVKRFICFDYNFAILLVTIVISLLVICGKDLFHMWKNPRKVLYFGFFYIVVAYFWLYSMAYLTELERIWMLGVLSSMVVFHNYGSKKEIYDNDVAVKIALCVSSCIFIFYSLYHLDKVMRDIVSEEAEVIYANNMPYIFTCSIIVIIMSIMSLIRRLHIKRIFYAIIYYVLVMLLAVHDIYYKVFNRLFSFKDMMLAGEGSEYSGYVLGLINGRFWSVFIPLIIIGVMGIFLLKYIPPISKECIIVVCSVITAVLLYSNTVYTNDYGEWDSFDNDNFIYETMNDRVRAFELCGFYQYELKDLRKVLADKFVIDIEHIESVTSFFKERENESKADENLMTGIFEGKNVIFILMESIDDILCREDVMPTLYRMSKEGINFSNMYAPIYGSAATMNSETVTNIGCYAPIDGSMIYSFAGNYFPYSIAARFTAAGYTARQYHFNIPDFYDRDVMNRAFGYKEYVSFFENVDKDIDTSFDTVLVENDVLYYSLIQDEKFFDYIITYSAHVPYDKNDNIVRAAMEKYPEYANITSFEEFNNYFAKARITDDMLDGLIKRLEQDGLLDNTVIIAIGDHYPYGILNKDTLYDFSGVEKYEQLLYKVPCIVWTPEIEAMEVDKIAGSIDLVPTIVNLMGLGDCSVYVGHDVFDDSYEGYAYFSDGSWIVRDNYYHQGKLVYGTMDKEEISDMNRKVMENISANDNILHTDYWRKN